MKLPKINENNIHGGVNWLPIGKSTHNNKPKQAAATEGSMEGI
jgi:hypothetical protein